MFDHLDSALQTLARDGYRVAFELNEVTRSYNFELRREGDENFTIAIDAVPCDIDDKVLERMFCKHLQAFLIKRGNGSA